MTCDATADEADGDWGFQSADSSDPQLSDTEVAVRSPCTTKEHQSFRGDGCDTLLDVEWFALGLCGYRLGL
jgi:hypothetical protein